MVGRFPEPEGPANRFYKADRTALGSFEVVLREMWERDLDTLADAIERERRG